MVTARWSSLPAACTGRCIPSGLVRAIGARRPESRSEWSAIGALGPIGNGDPGTDLVAAPSRALVAAPSRPGGLPWSRRHPRRRQDLTGPVGCVVRLSSGLRRPVPSGLVRAHPRSRSGRLGPSGARSGSVGWWSAIGAHPTVPAVRSSSLLLAIVIRHRRLVDRPPYLPFTPRRTDPPS